VLGIFLLMSVLFWCIVHFGLTTQNSLAPDLIERLDGDPLRIQAYLDEMVTCMLFAGIGALLAGAVLVCFWLVMIDRNPPHGDKSARSKRTSWAGLMLLALIVAFALFWFKVIGAPIAVTLSPSVPLYAAAAGLALVVLGYWVSTGLFAPASTKVAVPGGSLFAR
jgi:hypothetical protein